MSKAEQYAQWIVANQDKQGSSEFETVAKAYQEAKQLAVQAPIAKAADASYYAEGRKEGNPVIRGLANVVNGPTFGFGDEVVGAVGGAIKTLVNDKSLSQNYRETRDYTRGIQDQYKEDFPIGSTVTQLAASAPTIALNPLGKAAGAGLGAVAPKLAAWMNPATTLSGVLPNTLRAAVSGAGYGAVSGAGDSRAEDIGGVMGDAALSAATGAVLSGAVQPVAMGVKAVGNNVASRVSDSSAFNYAQQKVAEALGRDARGTVFESGAANPGAQAVARYRKLGPEATVADAGGENTRQLLDTLSTLPGRTKNQVQGVIHDRQAGRAGRLMAQADDSLGTGGAGFRQTVEALDATRKQAASPYYAQLKDLTAQVDDDVLALIQKTKGIHGEAQGLYRLQTGQDVALDGLKKGDSVPFGMLDSLKQSLNDAADSAKRQGNKRMGLALDEVRTQLTGKLDAIAPKSDGVSVYKLARDAYAGPSQLMDAAEMGRAALKADASEISGSLQKMAPSEVEAFRVGVLQALREKTGTQSGQTSILKMWMEPSTSQRLKEVFGKDYREFAAAVAKEARLKGLESVGRGSQTANRMFGAGDLDLAPLLDTASIAASAARGSPTGLLSGAANVWNRVQTPQAVRDQMGDVLLSKGAKGGANLAEMQGLIRRINQANSSQAQALGGLLGYSSGGLLNPPATGGLLGQ
jgi:hypothetical protein